MSTEIQPPRPLPLRVVGWMSLPWRHWVYVVSTLVFGLIFITVAPFPFIVRMLALVVPFLIALGLAVPYGGLHMDEWLLLAFRYGLRPSARMSSRQELAQDDGDLEALLEEGLDAEVATSTSAGSQPGSAFAGQEQPAGQPSLSGNRIYLAGTHGILRRGYGSASPSLQSGGPPAPGSGTPPTQHSAGTLPLAGPQPASATSSAGFSQPSGGAPPGSRPAPLVGRPSPVSGQTGSGGPFAALPPEEAQRQPLPFRSRRAANQ
jgi:hypothetical protein